MDQVVPVGMGKYIESKVPDAVATYYPHEGHHFVYERWREILAVLLTEARGRPRPHGADAAEPGAGALADMEQTV